MTYIDKPLTEIMQLFTYIVNYKKVDKLTVKVKGQPDQVSIIQPHESDPSKDVFYINGREAVMKDEEGHQVWRLYYQAVIGTLLSKIDTAAQPQGEPEVTYIFELNDGTGTVVMDYIPMPDGQNYWCMKNGEYTGMIVNRREFYGKQGLMEMFENLMNHVNVANEKRIEIPECSYRPPNKDDYTEVDFFMDERALVITENKKYDLEKYNTKKRTLAPYRRKNLTGAAIGLIYACSVMGVGFASGNEVLHFFTSYGMKGFYGIVAASVLYSFFGYAVVRTVYKTGADRLIDLYKAAGGQYFAGFAHVTGTLFSFCLFVLMLSAWTKIWNEIVFVPPLYAYALYVLLFYLYCIFDIQSKPFAGWMRLLMLCGTNGIVCHCSGKAYQGVFSLFCPRLWLLVSFGGVLRGIQLLCVGGFALQSV